MENINVKTLKVNAVQLGEILGTSPNRVRQLQKKNILQKDESNKYVLCDAIPEFTRYLRGLTKKAKAAATGLEGYKAQKMRASAEIEEMNLAQRKAKLVDIDSVVDIVKAEYSVVRQRLFSIPNKAALDVFACESPDEVHETLLRLINEALDELNADTSGKIEDGPLECAEVISEDIPS